MDSVAVSGSLRNRLVLTLIGGAAVLALLLFFAVRNYAVQVAQQGQDNILDASATSMLDAATIRDGAIEVDLPYAAFSMLSTSADDRVFYAILQDGEFLSGYAELTFSDSQTFQTDRNAALLGIGFFALAVALSFWVSSATIGQLGKLTTSVTRRGPQDLSPFTKPVPREMGPLVGSLNSLMGRLDQSLSQSEDFIAEAAHRVRTPLATVRSYAEATLQRVEKEENREAMRSMVKAIDESSRAAGQLLDHAMITFRADHLMRERIDLVDLVHDLVQRMTPIAEMKDLALSMQGDPRVPYSGDPVLIQNAVRNLIDNAMRYGPAESSIEITVCASLAVHISVCDHGPGFPVDEIETLTSRFKRGANAADTIGSGLGLTIALDVATAHGGKIELENQPEGGACVTLSL